MSNSENSPVFISFSFIGIFIDVNCNTKISLKENNHSSVNENLYNKTK